MKLKKLLKLGAIGLLAASLAACGGEDASDSENKKAEESGSDVKK